MMQFFSFITTGFRGSGAPVMFLILVILFCSIGLIIERVWYLYFKCGMNSSSFMSGISKFLKAGDYERAVKYASSIGTPLAKVVTTILQNRSKGYKATIRAVEEVFLTEQPRIHRFLPFLQAFANLAVLVGLMGTIYGFMEAFDSLANVPAAQRAQALAASIAVVMSSTLWGLIGAITALLGHAILANKADKLLEEMDEKSAKLINLVEE
jgi:biopolymer transport protein ExbB/TolQ